jgi:hypothetical protein
VFIDDKPLRQVLGKDRLESDEFYFDYANGKIYLADDPKNRKVEATVAAFAFESTAANVLIRNIIVEKYASVAQKGAIHASEATGWTIENCEVRWNSGAGIGIGTGGRVRDCDIHHNGQIGIAGHGRDISIEKTDLVEQHLRLRLYLGSRWREDRLERWGHISWKSCSRQHRSRVVVRYRLPQRRL